MDNELKVYLIGADRGIAVELGERSSRDEWDDLQANRGRWATRWVAVRTVGTMTTYVDRAAIVRVEVTFSPPISSEVAEKEASEAARAEERKRMGHDKPPYTDEPPGRR